MPGPIISKYIEQHGEDGFQEVVSIFRHDVVQFLGMLHSWMVLIESEVAAAPDHVFSNHKGMLKFQKAAIKLQIDVEHIFNKTRERLYPEIDKLAANYPKTAYISLQWDKFWDEFSTFIHPLLKHLEKKTCKFVAYPDFTSVVELSLGAAAGDETIKGLVLKPFSRLRAMLEIETFDARVAEVLQSRNNSAYV